MKALTPQLPTVLGAFSAMLVAFLSLLNGTSPATCLMKAFAAFLVFAGLGLIVRHALESAQAERENAEEESHDGTSHFQNLDVIVPGTSVADLLSDTPSGAEAVRGSDGGAQAA